MKKREYSFEGTYDFCVNTGNPYEEDERDMVSGQVTHYANAVWDESMQQYECASIDWSENSGQFTDYSDRPCGEAEEQFLEDFKNYLISQGVKSESIGW